MLSDEQKRVALKKSMETMSKEAKKLRADGVEEITLTYCIDEEPFRKMRLDVETDDFGIRQMIEAQHENPGGQHLSGADALALLGIK